MGTTSVYGWPYPELTDPPDGTTAIQALAEAVESDVQRIDSPTAVTVQAEELSVFSFTNTAAQAGTAVCGLTFVAPPSGKVVVTVSGNISSGQDGNAAILSYEVRTGSTIGSGTVVLGPDYRRAVHSSRAVNTGAVASIGASHARLLSGLTSGATYNARTMHWINPGGGGTVDARALLIQPVK